MTLETEETTEKTEVATLAPVKEASAEQAQEHETVARGITTIIFLMGRRSACCCNRFMFLRLFRTCFFHWC
jgi:hypothetical protein